MFEVDIPGFADLIGDDENDTDAPDDRQTVVQHMIEEAINWREEDLEPAQEKSTNYYHGRKFGTEEKGRSQVVTQEVADTVRAIMPSLMRVFWNPEHAVEFRAQEEEDMGQAEQSTDYINYIIQEDNPGFMTMRTAFKDALVRKQGIIKWWWDDSKEIEEIEFTGLSEMDLLFLDADDEVDYVIEEMTGEEGDEEYDVTVTRTRKKGRARIAAIPNEEFIFSPGARHIDTAPLVGHIRYVPASELLAMGVEEDDIEEAMSHAKRELSGALKSARRFDEMWDEEDDEVPTSQTSVLYCEAYVFIEDEVDEADESVKPAKLRKICTIGDEFKIVFDEPAPCRPFATFCPDPEAHEVIGSSIADITMDLQLINSQVLRGMLDSLSLALNPSQEFVETQVNPKDMMNTEIGNKIRVKKPGQIREVLHTFVGKEAFPMLDYIRELRENRTGISKAAAGLDADALQSSTKAAVAATLSGAQQHIEMIARIFAEDGMRRLFKGLLELVVQNQDKGRVIRLRNEYVNVDPRSWDATMDVTVNVALGGGLTEEKMQLLGMIIQDQKEQLANGSPLVTWVEYRKSLARFVEMGGWANADEFYRPFGEKELQEMQQAQAQQPQQPDPAMALVEVEREKAQTEAQIAAMKLQLQQQEIQLKDDRERGRITREMALKERELELKHQVDIRDSELKAQVARDRAAMDADIKRQQAGTTPAE
jgi:hypothetical protein